MYFPTAGIEVSPWLPPLVAFGISTFTSMGGVSGAFLLLPFQVSVLGFSSPAVSSTNQLFNIVAIPGGVYRYIREGRMVWPLVWAVVIGTLPGVFVGALLRVRYFSDAARFKLFVGLVLLYIGGRLLSGLLSGKAPEKGGEKKAVDCRADGRKLWAGGCAGLGARTLPLTAVSGLRFSLAEIRYEFCGQTCRANTLGLMALSLVVGIVGGVYGIGGGAIIAPFLVSFFGLPVHTVAGAALTGTLVTSVAGVAFYQLMAPFYPGMNVAPDWALGTLFGLGGFAGMYTGARLQKFVPATIIKWILAVSILTPALKYIAGALCG